MSRPVARVPCAVAVAALVALAGVVGCDVDPFCLTCGDGPPDGAVGEGGVVPGEGGVVPGEGGVDPRVDGGPCVPRGDVEICNGLDDECDGEIDEDFDLQTNPLHCGVCNNVCRAPNAEQSCIAGACVVEGCLDGFLDLDGVPGCEYRCPVFPGEPETCNGFDDDCDGAIDEAEDLTMPSEALCRTTPDTPCAGVTPVCATREGVTAWYCNYPPEVEFDPLVPNGIVLDEARCDGFDGDCDGAADERFEDLGEPCDDGELGACRDQGLVACDPADPLAVVCDLSLGPDPDPDAPRAETCNGVDDDCNGTVDDATGAGRVIDAMRHVDHGDFDFWIYTYEASRADATDVDPGAASARACSRADVLPWASVSHAAAAAACADAGKRLCTGAEWLAACEGAAGHTYPYGDTYGATSCNGADNDAVPGPPVTTALVPTGSIAACESDDGAFDLSGNLKEWTSDARGDTGGDDPLTIYVTRGGSHESPRLGLTCGTDLSRSTENTVLPTLGFRCCSDAAP